MQIVKREVVELSESEAKAFDLVERVVSGIIRTGECPELRQSASDFLESLYMLDRFLIVCHHPIEECEH